MLIDESQLVPETWDRVRQSVDEDPTGGAVPPRRFSRGRTRCSHPFGRRTDRRPHHAPAAAGRARRLRTEQMGRLESVDAQPGKSGT